MSEPVASPEGCRQWCPRVCAVVSRGPYRQRLRRTISDDGKILARRKALGNLYGEMIQALTFRYGDIPPRNVLLDLATETSRKKGIRLDRASCRLKEGLICWLCEHNQELLILNRQNAEMLETPDWLFDEAPSSDRDGQDQDGN
jgi:hypothetical protein